MREHCVAALVCAALVLSFAGPLVSAPSVRDVDCQKQSLGDAINKADPGDTLRVSGTCRERIVVAVDRLTLDGQGAATLDGGGHGGGTSSGAIFIDGARGVTVRGFTIQNSSGGIVGLSNAAFKVQNTILRENTDGIEVLNGSVAEIADCTVINNVDGIDVVNGSSAIFTGSVKVNNNGKGVSGFGSSTLELRGGTLEASGNGTEGISMSGSSFNIFGIPESLGGSIVVNENGTDGILIGGGQLVIEASEPASRVITALNNKGSGINLPGFASVVNLGAAKFVLKGNAVGLNLGTESSLLTVGGLNVEGNGTGLLADGAGSLTLISIPPNPSAIQGNTVADTDLRFGTRMTVNGATLGNLKCDATVLSRGTTKCP
jgi:Right handed beta helix region